MMDLASPRVGEAAAAGKSSIVIATSRTGGGSVAAFAGRAPAATHNAKIVHPKTLLSFMEKTPPAGAEQHPIATFRRT